MRRILSRNPFTSEIHKQFDFLTNDGLKAKLKKAEEGFKVQAKRTYAERGGIIENLANIINRKQKVIAQMITAEMGKPITQSIGQVKKVVSFCRYYSKNFEPILPVNIKTDAKKKTLIKFKPLGTIYYLVPFNFPFFLNFKGGLSNLMLGNCLLTRNSDSTPMLGNMIEELMKEAGFDAGEYQNVFTSHQHLDTILGDRSVGGVSFTGSSKAGAIIAEKAGKHLKKSVMQLGGNDPFVVLLDANREQAVQDAIVGRCRNAGQVCFSPKRFIVVQEHYQKFKQALIEGLSKVKVGDPMKPETEMGPLAREDLSDILKTQVNDIPSSWKVIYRREDMKKPFYPITVIEGTDQQYDHEMFGPIYSLFRAKNEQHAIQLANAGTYGLSASVYSANRGQEALDRIRCGMGFVNETSKSDYSFPTGGVARSGYGRQCWVQGYRSFANIKLHYES